MDAGRLGRRSLPALLAGALLLGLTAPPVPARDTAAAAGVLEEEQVFDPDQGEQMDGTEPAEPPSDAPIDPDAVPTPEGEEEVADETVQQPGWGSAADQSTEAKVAEAEQDCAGAAPPVSRMLGLPGSVGGSDGGSLGPLVLIIAAGALAVAAIAFALRRRRGPAVPRGSLESVATVVGILGGIAGLAVQFVPGVGAREALAPSASMAVRDVNARIARAEYARKLNSELPRPEDRREVGNVVWLEIRLEGYGDRRAHLQYGLYDTDAGDALLPGTAVRVPIPRGGEDVETHFVPIWVGHPLSEHFKASFRLLDGDRVQAIAETGRMRASRFRYSCAP